MSSLVPLYLPILYSQHLFGGCVQWKGCRASVSVRRAFSSFFSVGKIQQPVGENLFSWFPFFTPVKRSLKSMLQRSKINKNLHQEILKESLFKVYFKFLLQEFLHFSSYQKVEKFKKISLQIGNAVAQCAVFMFS